MALERKDNIGDTSSTTGTGTLNLAAVAQSGARIFAGNVTSGATVRYDIRSSDNTEWEIGEGVFTDGSPDTLTRVTVYASSNSGSLVNFSAGTKNVSMVATARDFVGEIAPVNLLKNGNFINNSTNGYGSTPDDWTSSNANPVQGGIPALTKQNLIDGIGIADGDIEGLWNLNNAYTDLSANGYDLTASGSPVFSDGGLMAKALDLEASSSQYATNASANCNITGSQTWIAYIKPESIGAYNIIGIRASGGGSAHGIYMQVTTGKVSMFLTGLTTTTDALSDVQLQAGIWYMVVGVYDSANSKLKIWVNGVKKEYTASGSATSVVQNLSIGRWGAENASYYDGLIQNAAVLSVALTDNQVKKLFAMTMYKGVKLRRASMDCWEYQELPQNLVEQYRGKTLTVRADMYQDVASTGQLEVDDGTGSPTELNSNYLLSDAALQAYWRLESNFTDASANGYTLTAGAGAAAPTDVTGLFGNGKNFLASDNERASIANASCPNLEITGSQTWYCWYKPASIGANQCVLSKRQTGAGTIRELYLQTDGSLTFYVQGLTTNAFVNTGPGVVAKVNEWNLLVGVYDSTAGKLKVWLNGVKTEVTSSGSGSASTGDFWMGISGFGTTTAPADGIIDDAAVLNRALSDDEIMRLYNGGYTTSVATATTGSWVEHSVTKNISANAKKITVRKKVSTSNGNIWFKNVSLYEGSVLLPYDHSKDDWSRFPRLLRMDIPSVVSAYQFEENRLYTGFAPTYAGFSTAPTGTISWSFCGQSATFRRRDVTGGTSNATTFTMTFPVVHSVGNTSIPVNVQDNSVNQSALGHLRFVAGVAAVDVFKTFPNATWTSSGGKDVFFDGISLQIA